MAFTAQDVKTLREMTNVGMMGLQRRPSPRPTAIWIRQSNGCVRRGALQRPQRRPAALLPKVWLMQTFAPRCGVGAVVEVNCETDFCAKSEPFVNFVKDICHVVINDNPRRRRSSPQLQVPPTPA